MILEYYKIGSINIVCIPLKDDFIFNYLQQSTIYFEYTCMFKWSIRLIVQVELVDMGSSFIGATDTAVNYH